LVFTKTFLPLHRIGRGRNAPDPKRGLYPLHLCWDHSPQTPYAPQHNLMDPLLPCSTAIGILDGVSPPPWDGEINGPAAAIKTDNLASDEQEISGFVLEKRRN